MCHWVSGSVGQWLEGQGTSSSDDPAAHHPPLWQSIIILKFYLGRS